MATAEPVMVDDVAIVGFQDCRPEDGVSRRNRPFFFRFRSREQLTPAGVLVAGLNPHRQFDADFRGFVSLLVNQIAAGIGNAMAHEEERRRAEALAEIDRAKTLFFTNVSHRVSYPADFDAGPAGGCHFARPVSILRDQARQQLELVHRNALRLLKLVNTLLDFSRIEAGRLQAIYEPTDLASATAELASMHFAPRWKKRVLVFTWSAIRCPNRFTWIARCGRRSCSIFFPTPSSSPSRDEISLALKAVDDAVQLSVSDTGTGIPEHEIPRVFERFHRVKGAKGRSFEGTGIGLSLVQELVKLHGGSVRVESALGKGSTFTVSIPRRQGAFAARPSGAAPWRIINRTAR